MNKEAIEKILTKLREDNKDFYESERLKRENAIPCEVCGRMLTDPESVARGVGPECAQAGFVAGPVVSGTWHSNEGEEE